MIPYSTGDGNLNEPIKEDVITTMPVNISGEIVIVNGMRTYHIANTDIDEMSHAVLKEILVELMEEGKG